MNVRESRSRQTACQTSPSPLHWVSAEVLHFDTISAHLPGDANWIRQMEWEFKRRLIPFEDFESERNLQLFLVFHVKYPVCCFHLFMFYIPYRHSMNSLIMFKRWLCNGWLGCRECPAVIFFWLVVRCLHRNLSGFFYSVHTVRTMDDLQYVQHSKSTCAAFMYPWVGRLKVRTEWRWGSVNFLSSVHVHIYMIIDVISIFSPRVLWPIFHQMETVNI